MRILSKVFQRLSSLGGLLACCAVAMAPASRAEIITFQIDSSQSVLNYSGNVNGGIPVVEQAPGSFASALVGTFSLNVDFETGEFSFAPGYSFSFPDKPGTAYLPFGTPASYGLKADLAPGLTSYAAMREAVGGLSSGVLTVDENLLFPASEVTVDLKGTFSAEIPGLLPPTSFLNIGSIPNASLGFGQVELTEDTIKLTLPIDISFTSTNNGVALNSRLQGTLVGVVVPEAGSMALVGLAGLGGAAVALLRRRRGASSVN